MPLSNKLGAVVALIAVGLLASFSLVWPARDVAVFGLSFTLSGRMLLGLVLVGLAWTGTDIIMGQHPSIHSEQSNLLAMHCILPAALTAAAWVLVARPDGTEIKIIGVTVTSGLLGLLIIAEYYVVRLAGRWRTAIDFFLRLMVYLVAVLLYMGIRLSMSADLTATIAVAAGSAILGRRLLGDGEGSLRHIPALGALPHSPVAELVRPAGLCALGVGALSGVSFWLVNLWGASPLLHSLVLVVVLYMCVGTARHFLRGKLTQRVALEYLLVGVAVLLLLLSYAR